MIRSRLIRNLVIAVPGVLISVVVAAQDSADISLATFEKHRVQMAPGVGLVVREAGDVEPLTLSTVGLSSG